MMIFDSRTYLPDDIMVGGQGKYDVALEVKNLAGS